MPSFTASGCLTVAVIVVALSPASARTPLKSSVVEVTPKNFQSTFTSDKVGLVAFHIPHLPLWQEFRPVLETVAEHFALQDDVVIASADAHKHRTFVKQHALRAFPALFVLPPALPNALPLPIDLKPNMTAHDLAQIIDIYLHVSAPLDALEPIQEDIIDFLSRTESRDFDIAWKSGAERRERMARREREFRRKIMGEDVPEPAPKEEEEAEAEEETGAGAEGDDTAVAVDADAEAAAIAPLLEAAEHVLANARRDVKKAEFLIETMQRMEKIGTAVVAKGINENTKALYRQHARLSDVEREDLVMRIAILNRLADSLL